MIYFLCHILRCILPDSIEIYTNNLVQISKSDWDAYETSWDFTTLPLLHRDHHRPTLRDTYAHLRAHWMEITLEMQRLEEENNRLFIEAYGLQDELTPEVPLAEITLTCNPYYRFKEGYRGQGTGIRGQGTGSSKDNGAGCRSLPLSSSSSLSPTPCPLPPTPSLEEDLEFIADALGRKKDETSRDTIRRYFATGFFKDHLQTYKRRPIYWLFTSGKLRAFQCLVYLHRYNEGTLARMRTEYVIPLQGKMAARMEHLDGDIVAAGTTSQRKKHERERDLLRKQLDELRTFDEELRHVADSRIALDLDDGVKVNYGKFGNLLAEADKISG